MSTDKTVMGGISVIVSTYDDPINVVDQCLNTLLYQEKIYEIIVVDSSKKDEIKKLCQLLNNSKIHYFYTPPRGLSDARNKGMQIATRNIIAFTDADCIADKDWSDNIYKSFYSTYSEKVAIVGGKILPKWIVKPNNVLLNSAIAQGFYSSFDMGEESKEVYQIFGANFAINKKLTLDQNFMSQLGRKKENLLCGEELDFCKRVIANGFKVMYNPSMVVLHQIPEERTKFEWIWKRMYYGGITRAMLGGQPTPKTVNFVSYNIYDVLFLAMFIVPYMYGLLSTQIRQRFSI